jgi:large subunit ribosomal protein L25
MESNQDLKLEVYPRSKTGRSASYQTRTAGLIPAVIYSATSSKEGKSIPVSLNPANFRKVYATKGKSTILSVDPKDGAPTEWAQAKVLFKEVQTHPLKNTVVHVDIHELDLKKPIRIVVPLAFVGKAKGLAEGGIMSIISRQVEIKSLPQNIPNHIDVDVSELGLNESLKIDDLAKKLGNEKYELIYDNSFALVAIAIPEEEKAAEPAADAAAAAAPGATPAAGAAAAPAADAKAAGGDKAAAKK